MLVGFSGTLTAVADVTSFLSRLPIRKGEPSAPLARTLRFAPIAGCIVALPPAAVLVLATSAGLPSSIAAILACAGLIFVTGALHEDGLADVADGFGGGRDAAQALAIMRDSRLGTYGVLALTLALLTRVACLQSLIEHAGAIAAAAALIGTAAVSRSLMLIPLRLLVSPRSEGLAYRVGPLQHGTMSVSLALAVLIGGATMTGSGSLRGLTALLLGSAASLAMAHLARRKIGGVTGDVVGASQVLSELAMLVTLCAVSSR